MTQNFTIYLSFNASISPFNPSLGFGVFHVPNPFVVVQSDESDEKIVGISEILKKTRDPSWTKCISIPYRFGSLSKMKICVYDYRGHYDDISKSKLLSDLSLGPPDHLYRFIGSTEIEINDVISNPEMFVERDIHEGSRRRGIIRVFIEERNVISRNLTLQLRALDLVKKKNNPYRKTRWSPFYVLKKKRYVPSGMFWDIVHRSEEKKGHCNPIWDEAEIDLSALCDNDPKNHIRLDVLDNPSEKFIGSFEISVEKLVSSESKRGNACAKEGIPLSSNDVAKGNIIVLKAKVEDRQVHFLEYLAGGCDIHLLVGIDYSQRDGSTISQAPLEALNIFEGFDRTSFDDFEKALSVISSFLIKFDTDQQFTVWGFGASLENQNREIFNCGSDVNVRDEVEVNGVEGILSAYRAVFRKKMTCHSEAFFAPLIREGSRYAEKRAKMKDSSKQLSYNVLLILTSGKINDVEETMLAMKDAYQMPLSIIFIGIGAGGDFNEFIKMENVSPYEKGFKERRMKFVRFDSSTDDGAKLGEKVLEDIPDQLVRYFQENGVAPLTDQSKFKRL